MDERFAETRRIYLCDILAHLSILGFANLVGVRIDLKGAANIGKLATKISNESGIKISKVPDPRFGEVNAYHKDVLDSIFSNLYNN